MRAALPEGLGSTALAGVADVDGVVTNSTLGLGIILLWFRPTLLAYLWGALAQA